MHWCIKSIYNGFAIAIDCTLKLCLLVLILSKSSLSSESHFVYLGEMTKIHLAAAYCFFWDLGIFEANLYTL